MLLHRSGDFSASLIRTLDNLFAKKRFDLAVALSALSPGEPVQRALAATPQIGQAGP